MRYRFILILLLVSSDPHRLYADSPGSVPINHPVYSFLDRMETLGLIDNIRDAVKPLSRGRVSSILTAINAKRDELTVIDRDRLDSFLLDFRFEINRLQKYEYLLESSNWYSPFASMKQFKSDFKRFFKRNQPEEENHVVLWEDSTNSFYFDFIQDFVYDRRDDDVYRTRNAQTFRFRGTLSDKFSLALDVTQMALNGDMEYRIQDPIMKGSWNNTPNGTTFFDRSGGELVYRSPFLDFRFAHQSIKWGLGEFSQLILSDNVEQYPYFSISKEWKWGSFTFVHGKLLSISGPDTVLGQPIYPDKWIAAHRLEFSPFSSMAIGLSESIVYGNRSPEWAYFLPFNFYRATEHYLRDRDNEMVALDMEARLIRGVKVYGTFFIDELFTSKLFTDWYGNKHGFQAGLHLTDPFHLSNLSLRFEYFAVMPWVYTHRFGINSYTSDGRSLGFSEGPNSQVFFARLQKRWHHRFVTGVQWHQLKHGDNYDNENIGGDILTGHDTLLGGQIEARETRDFLEGILTTENTVEFFSQLELFNDFFINFSIASQSTRVAGMTTDHTVIDLGLKLDY